MTAADLRDRGRARDALRGHRADGVARGEVAGGDPVALACAVMRVERLDERDGLGVGAGVEGRCVRPSPRDEERVLAGGGDGGLVAAARLAQVDARDLVPWRLRTASIRVYRRVSPSSGEVRSDRPPSHLGLIFREASQTPRDSRRTNWCRTPQAPRSELTNSRSARSTAPKGITALKIFSEGWTRQRSRSASVPICTRTNETLSRSDSIPRLSIW